MNLQMKIKCVCVLVLLVPLAGCALLGGQSQKSLKPNSMNRVQPASPELRLHDHHEWVKRLMASPAVEGVSPAVSSAAATVLAIPLPPAATRSGVSYSLRVNQHAQLVWLQSHGYNGQVLQVQGPWQTGQADAAHLLHSVTATTNSAAPRS